MTERHQHHGGQRGRRGHAQALDTFFATAHEAAFRRADGGAGGASDPAEGGAGGEHHERSDRGRRGGRHAPGGPGPEFEGRGRGRRGGPRGRYEEPEPVQVSTEAIVGWLTGRLPDDWFTGTAELVVDRDEITVIGTLTAPETPADADGHALAAAEEGRITRFRESTREQRVAIAREAEHRYGRTIAWGAQVGDTKHVFTNRSVPVMTRLRQPERHVLDTLVDAGVARSRSDALAWCVRLVGRNSDEWLSQLREAMASVERVREQGPGS